jgi:hypothetical protein
MIWLSVNFDFLIAFSFKAAEVSIFRLPTLQGSLRMGYKAGRYAHARQFKRMRKVIKRQRTIVGRLQGEVARKMTALSQAVQETLGQNLDKAIQMQGLGDKSKVL